MDNESCSDKELVECSRRGDHRAFRVLLERYQRRAFAVAFSIVRNRDDAMDVCQAGFLRAYRALDRFDGEAQFFTWLYRIIHNLAIDHLRSRRARTVPLDHADRLAIAEERVDVDPARRLANSRLRARIDSALAQLSPEHRAVVTLREVHGLSYQQIADVVGCPIGTVMSRLFHARKALQRELIDEGAALGLAA